MLFALHCTVAERDYNMKLFPFFKAVFCFALMIIAVILSRSTINLSAVLAAAVSMPSVIFFAIGIIGMTLMGIFAAKLDSSSLRSNWIEQLTNAAAQASVFTGILILFLKG